MDRLCPNFPDLATLTLKDSDDIYVCVENYQHGRGQMMLDLWQNDVSLEDAEASSSFESKRAATRTKIQRSLLLQLLLQVEPKNTKKQKTRHSRARKRR